MQLTLALEVPEQLRVLEVGLCLDGVNHSILLSSQHALHMSVNLHHWGFPWCLFIGTHLNIHNRKRVTGL